ncbi:hypothetical protein EV361DRAFT_44602 [Lentinula raphanica]|nr:hypothetical protein F5880DRAFT_1605600 [Lentinula raphanica]KAJ3964599.1 hypothetical protein EV361DRAFT_44602 [Lentinula raphanica]
MTDITQSLDPSKPPINYSGDLERSLHGEALVDSNAGARYQKPSLCQVSPIRLLSTEILQLVFLFAASHKSHEFATYVKRSRSSRRNQARAWAGALSLTWVCSWWRKVALSYPPIWRSIHIDVRENSFTHPWFGDFIGEYLRRSGPSFPLDIGLNLDVNLSILQYGRYSEEYDHHDFEDYSDILRVLNHLADCAWRWRRFEFTSGFSTDLERFTDILVTKMAARSTSSPKTLVSFPLLHEVELHTHRSYLPFRATSLKFFTHCRFLRFLKAPIFQITDTMDLTNLVFLQTPLYAGDSFGYLLQQCPRLKYLSIGYLSPYYKISATSMSTAPATPAIPSIVHNHLTSLCLNKIGEEFPAGVWDNVSLPNLTQLGIAFEVKVWHDTVGNIFPVEYFYHPVALEELQRMCLRSGCYLEKVWVGLTIELSAEIPRIRQLFNEFPHSEDFTTEISEEPSGIEREAYLEYIDELR